MYFKYNIAMLFYEVLVQKKPFDGKIQFNQLKRMLLNPCSCLDQTNKKSEYFK